MERNLRKRIVLQLSRKTVQRPQGPLPNQRAVGPRLGAALGSLIRLALRVKEIDLPAAKAAAAAIPLR